MNRKEPAQSNQEMTTYRLSREKLNALEIKSKEAVNPLVSLAEPLLVFASWIKQTHNQLPLNELHENLTREVRNFETKAHALNYRIQVILAARYLLCALLDEMIINAQEGKYQNWNNQSLLKTFQREAWNGEHFFLILQRSAEDLATYGEVLELGFVCLNLGYQGKYQKSPIELRHFVDGLYQIIKHQRGDFSRWLFVNHQKPKIYRRKLFSRWQVPLAIFLTLLILSVIYFSYYSRLEKIVPLSGNVGVSDV